MAGRRPKSGGDSGYSFNRDRHPAAGNPPGGVTSDLRTRPGTMLLNGLTTTFSTSDAPVKNGTEKWYRTPFTV
jgi:hypothetical protein